MNPEQQAEFQRREQRKAFTTNLANAAMQILLQESPTIAPEELASRSFNIGEAMARERVERGHEH